MAIVTVAAKGFFIKSLLQQGKKLSNHVKLGNNEVLYKTGMYEWRYKKIII